MIKSPGQPLFASQTPTIGGLHARSESTWRSVRVLLIDDHELFAQSVQQRFARAAPEQQFRFEHRVPVLFVLNLALSRFSLSARPY